MTDNKITIQISGTPEAVSRFLDGMKPQAKKPEPWFVTETPWFERHGKLTPEEVADLEASAYGKSDPA